MPIDAEPTVLAVIYDRWTLASLSIVGDALIGFGRPRDEARPIAASGVLVKYRLRDDGGYERSPLAADTIEVKIPDLYAAAAIDPDLATLLTVIPALVLRYGREQRLVAWGPGGSLGSEGSLG